MRIGFKIKCIPLFSQKSKWLYVKTGSNNIEIYGILRTAVCLHEQLQQFLLFRRPKKDPGVDEDSNTFEAKRTGFSKS